MIGSLGDIVFTSSTLLVNSFTDLAKTSKSKYVENEIIANKPKLTYMGEELDEYAIKIKLMGSLGVNPQVYLTKLESYKTDGEILILMLGSVVKGQVIITDIKSNFRQIDNNGVANIIEVDLSLKEYN